MLVMNHKGDIFDERRKKERREKDEPVEEERRAENRRKKDINKFHNKEAGEMPEAEETEEIEGTDD